MAKPIKLELTDEDIRLHDEGNSFAFIARKRKVDPQAMRNCFRRSGFQKRDRQLKLKPSQFNMILLQLGFF
jgi:hypothetical protein